MGAQPATTPSSVANRNALGPVRPPFETTKPEEALNTIPLGFPPPLGVGGRNLHNQWDEIAGALIECRDTGTIVGNPDKGEGIERNAPGR